MKRLAALLLALTACGAKPRELIVYVDYDPVLIDTPWCVVAYVATDDDEEIPVRVCVPNEKICKRGVERATKPLVANAARIRAIGDCVDEGR
ncbi:MAG TPA: hypothetical protein VF183_04725 [Acidimicrobiales bacterium]